MKICSSCKIQKPYSEFSKNKASKDLLNCYCRLCHSAITKAYKSAHPDKMRQSAAKSRSKRKDKDWECGIKRNYGVDAQQYNDLFNKQQGKCGGCDRHQSALTKRLCVDHCHKTGDIRGLLCYDCNVALGRVFDNAQTLIKLAEYLNKDFIKPKLKVLA